MEQVYSIFFPSLAEEGSGALFFEHPKMGTRARWISRIKNKYFFFKLFLSWQGSVISGFPIQVQAQDPAVHF
jgi:cytochrome bd-type quinol oxidase subunit 1